MSLQSAELKKKNPCTDNMKIQFAFKCYNLNKVLKDCPLIVFGCKEGPAKKVVEGRKGAGLGDCCIGVCL